MNAGYRRAAAVMLCVVSAACAANPGYRTGADLPPLSVELGELVEERLAALGYEVTDVAQHAASVTFSAVKIKKGVAAGSLVLDWLHVTYGPNRILSQPAGAEATGGYWVEVRAESFDEGRERRAIPPTAQVVADADAFVASLEAQSASTQPGENGG